MSPLGVLGQKEDSKRAPRGVKKSPLSTEHLPSVLLITIDFGFAHAASTKNNTETKIDLIRRNSDEIN